mmetsp:Transcript_73353/g.147705  ORF Transcript_73353/g.147705 Transcript_73353/m.147705 type:complete len:216 (-) Transcript_73353:1766-2413(-)
MKIGACATSSFIRFSLVARSVVTRKSFRVFRVKYAHSFGRGNVTVSMRSFQLTSIMEMSSSIMSLSAFFLTNSIASCLLLNPSTMVSSTNTFFTAAMASKHPVSTSSTASSSNCEDLEALESSVVRYCRNMSNICGSSSRAKNVCTSKSSRPSKHAQIKFAAAAFTPSRSTVRTRGSNGDCKILSKHATNPSVNTSCSWLPWQGPCIASVSKSMV